MSEAVSQKRSAPAECHVGDWIVPKEMTGVVFCGDWFEYPARRFLPPGVTPARFEKEFVDLDGGEKECRYVRKQ